MSYTDTLPDDLTQHRLLNSAQTAKILGFSAVHLRRLVKAGKVPQPVRIGERKLAWRAAEIRAFVEAQQAA
jgi:predicted DNA-binding transcriptional regulator AlpA